MPELNKHAILIGINSVPNLDYLFSPSSYAIKMENWARSQGYKTELFVDEPLGELSGKCERRDIKNAIKTIIEEGTDQLLIYFSGHGIEHTAGNDVWLLPGYLDDSAECISISLSRSLALNTGIPHVIFISDACRTLPNDRGLRAAFGESIFPVMDIINPTSKIDVLYSTWPGHISTDVRIGENEYVSIYSEHLLDCLQGNVPEVIRKIEKITPGFPALMAYELSESLIEVVPKKMRQAGRNVQIPMGDINSRDPRFLSRFDFNTSSIESRDRNLEFENISVDQHENRAVEVKYNQFIGLSGRAVKKRSEQAITQFIRHHDFFTSPGILENNITGVFVEGLINYEIYSNRETNFLHRKHRGLSPLIIDRDLMQNNLTLVIGNQRLGRYYPVTVLPGYFTHAVFDKNRLLTVNYYPTEQYSKEEAHFFSEELAKRKAIIIMAAQNGIFQGDNDVAADLRRLKLYDPTLGLFAIYAYFQKGNYEGVRSVYTYMLYDSLRFGNFPDQVVNNLISDIRLIGKLSTREKEISLEGMCFPVLTEGWSYLKMLKNNPFSDLTENLLPGLWTSFDRQGLKNLIINYNFRIV